MQNSTDTSGMETTTNNLEFLTQPTLENGTQISNEMAKEYTLDIPRIPSVELPLHVLPKQNSIHRAVEMCGGLGKIKDAFAEDKPIDSQRGLELYLNKPLNIKDMDEGDGFFNEHPIIGKKVPFRDHSVVLKIVMPKGTLKKNNGDVQQSLASLQNKNYKVTPVAVVDNTIKFREMSDFQVRLDNVPSAKEYQSSFGTLDWNKFKTFVDSVPDNDTAPQENINSLIIDRSVQSPNTDFQLPPPPRLSMVGFPHVYKYKKNPLATKKSNGISEVKGSYIKNYQLFVHELNENTIIPTEPHESLQTDYKKAQESKIYPGTKDTSKFYESLEDCLEILNRLFEERPIWIKRHLDGIIPKCIHHTLKIALALISYRFTMGPWRNTYIKFSCDPRESKEYAKYQTEYFKIERKLLSSPKVRKNIPKLNETIFESNTSNGIDTRFRFDGKQIPWYLMLQIDLLICEPNVAEIYEQVEYLEKPNEITGWFKELDLVKIRRIVKYELGCLAQGNDEFNKYKLKYFKSMQFVKESMINDEQKKQNGDTVVDADGDIDMDTEAKVNVEDDDDDNGIVTGEADDEVLEAEESDTNENIAVEGDDEKDFDTGNLDLDSSNFQDIIARIRKMDPQTAEYLSKQLNGFVNENKI